MRVTVHAGEPGAGIPAVRARIEAAWGARAFDHAGMTEMGAYGYECEAQAGLHVNESEFIAEVIDPVTGAPAPRGRAGADQPRAASARRSSAIAPATACGWPTGRARAAAPSSRLEGGILGRLDDMLIVRGVNVFPSAIEAIVRRFPPSTSSRSRCSATGELDEVRVLVEVDDGGRRRRRVQEALRGGARHPPGGGRGGRRAACRASS